MTFEEYVTYKLSVKLNLWFSKGRKTHGVINDALVSKLASNVCDFGKYRIITKMSFPVDIERDDLVRPGAMMIDFTPDEFRNKKLVSILK